MATRGIDDYRISELDDLMNLAATSRPGTASTRVRDQLSQSREELERRGTGPARRQERQSRALRTERETSRQSAQGGGLRGRRGRQSERRTRSGSGGNEGGSAYDTGAAIRGQVRDFLATPDRLVRQGVGAFNRATAPAEEGLQSLVRGLSGADRGASRVGFNDLIPGMTPTGTGTGTGTAPRGRSASDPPASVRRPEQQTGGSRSGQQGGQSQTGRQTTFTNADAEAAGPVNTIPAVEPEREPSQLEQALMQAVENLQPRRQQATLIEHTPEPRMASNAFEERLRLRQQEQQLAERQIDQQADTAEQTDRRERAATAASLLAQMQGQERQLQAQLSSSLAEAEANANTPQGRLAAMRAAQIEEALVRLRAAQEENLVSPEEGLRYLFDVGGQRQPIESVGGTVGTFDTLSGEASLFDERILRRSNPQPRER